MKRLLSILFSLTIILTMLPMQSFAAKAKTVEFYGNSIPAGVRQLSIYKYTNYHYDYANECGQQYIIPQDAVLDCKEIAEKFPDLYRLMIIDCELENEDSLADIKNLAWFSVTYPVDEANLNNINDISYLKNMKSLKYLRCVSESCEDISAIGNLTNLKELHLDLRVSSYSYRIKDSVDISPLKNLTNIENLTLYCNTYDISPIGSMKKLKNLDIRNTKLENGLEILWDMPMLADLKIYGAVISDEKQLSGLKQVKSLNLTNCHFDSEESFKGISELQNLEKLVMYYYYGSCISSYERIYTEPLSQLTNLKSLKIRNHGVHNLDFVKDMTSLEELYLHDCVINDISGLENHAKLKNLYLTMNGDLKINTKPLETLKNLETLDLFYSDGIKGFSFLAKLGNLKYLDIRGTDWKYDHKSKTYVEKFIAEHPECKVDI